jgi:hypothetical protein
MGLVHEVDGEHAVHRVLQSAAGADLLEPAAALRQDPAADDQVQLVQRQLAVARPGALEARQLVVEVGQIGQRVVGGEAETRDGVSSVCPGSSFAEQCDCAPG